ncbi:MAG TPA: glycosyl hydrolase family 18 protein, partial [Candidatus Nanopelagicales bacterium]|nr:glycosyl hydrolase family 18 protein [Candidatus Nanopelagicales bacterium]
MISRTTGSPGHVRRALATTLAAVFLAALPAGVLAAEPAGVPGVPGDAPSQMYLDAMAHEGLPYAFTPGAPAEADARSFALAEVTPSAVGMRREVYGFLPYWMLADPDTHLDFSILTHVAYFSVGADAKGNLKKRDADGSLTTGWGGWTSSTMTSIINAAHAKRGRVTLTLTVFAWTSGQAAVQKALLGSASARLNLARQAVDAVRDRGADGINLDFEPLVAGYEDEFVALVRTIRAELDREIPGAHLSFDTLGRPGNYPLERALAPGGADAVFVMGYDYRTAGATYAGSIDPLAGPAYDLADTVRAYTARVPASRVILGIPYYGRAWSTVSDAVNAQTRTGAKYGYSVAVNYATAVELAAEHGRRYDGREVSAWVAYRKESCTATYGCVTTWRQLYYDDAATLRARYDLVIRSGLRGAGIWALGYDGARPELYRALAEKLVKDTTAPAAGIVALPPTQPDEGFTVRWTAEEDWSGIAGFDVEVSVDGGAWTDWLVRTKATSGLYLGSDNHGYAFRVRARDGKGNLSAWNVSSVHDGSPRLEPGGFLRVTGASLNVRTAPDTSAAKVATASRGDLFAITGGPVTADGQTWYEVSGPLATWGAVQAVESSVWVASSGSGVTNAVAAQAPNATLVQAGIRWVGFSGGGTASLGTTSAAVGQRSFSPNGDGSGDLLAIRWNNRHALESLTLRVLGRDGTLLGTRAVPATGSGTQDYGWDGTVGDAVLPDGTYVLQLVGTAGGATSTWPADSPTAGDLPARTGVVIDRAPPALEASKASGTRLSPNGDGTFDALRISGTGSADVARWDVVIAPLIAGAPGEPIRRIAGRGRSASAYWDGTADDGTRVPDGAYRATLRLFDAAGNAAARSWPATVDATPPALSVTAAPAAISPDGDDAADTVRLRWASTEPARGTLRILRGTTVVRSWSIGGTGGAVTWDGHDAAGRTVADGRYAVAVTGSDALANRATTSIPLVVDRTAAWLRWSPTAFHPQDGDRLAPTATLSVRIARAARLTLRILDASGTEIRVPWRDREVARGVASWRWDGRTAGGALVLPGRYVAEMTAVGPYGTTVLRRTIVADAFIATPATVAPPA